MPSEGYRPDFRIYAGDQGKDITPTLNERLLSITLDQEAEDRSDRLTLRLADYDDPKLGRPIAFPEANSLIRVSLGWVNALTDFGKYRVDEITYRSPPAMVEIKASAAAFSKSLRSAKTRDWKDETLASMTRKIAEEHGYEARIQAGEIGSKDIPSAHQQHESDIEFLNNQAELWDAEVRPVNDLLVLVKKNNPVSVSGKPLPGLTLRPSDVSDWEYTFAARRAAGEADDGTGGVKAYYRDYDAGETKAVTVGEPPYEEVKWVHPSEYKARAAAASKYNREERRKRELTVSMEGTPKATPEGRLHLEGWRPNVPTEWRITSVQHTYKSASGFRTDVTGELANLDEAKLP